MSLQENSMLGPYRIAGILGEGGMGAVYRAKDTRLGRDVAIKVLTGLTLSDKERLIRFEQEARATGMLNHPNLLTIYDVGHAQGTPFLVSELLEGQTLRERLTRGPLPPRRAVDAAVQMAQGLAAAHEKGVVHRDLKPDNIFLTRDGRVKILDFGIAKLTARSGADGPSFEMAATEPGMVLGTVGYMSPEQVRGEPVDHRSDLFSFGTILFEMLTGNRAFKHDSAIETLGAILKEEPPDVSELLPGVPAALDRIVRRCLEKDREQRFQSARDLAFAFETLTMTPGTLTNTARPSAPMHSGAQAPQTQPPRTQTHVPTVATPSVGTPAVPTSHPTQTRTRTMIAPVAKPKRRVSPLLLALLYLVSIAGAAFAAWKWATRDRGEAPEVQFTRMTFRRGDVRGARFAPDGDTIVYSAAWDGQPSEIFVASRRAPEARPLGVPDAEVLAVSKSAELAILLHRDRLTSLGTLARVPLAGGMPREVANDVLQADWAADGQLAIIRAHGDKYRLEYPIGTVRYETAHYIRDVRVSPDGARIAFLEPVRGEYDLVVAERNAQPQAIARGWSRGATGLAWSPDGQSLWLTGTNSAAPPSLYAVTLTGDTRLVSRLTGSMKLFDISAENRVLLSNGTWRAALLVGAAGASPAVF
ncbi:MAG TPA: protein kinase, partial [Thermoanaerobaculia bacterium]|nr:protein kinase [Thermoanaerobaculia bacterium]